MKAAHSKTTKIHGFSSDESSYDGNSDNNHPNFSDQVPTNIPFIFETQLIISINRSKDPSQTHNYYKQDDLQFFALTGPNPRS